MNPSENRLRVAEILAAAILREHKYINEDNAESFIAALIQMELGKIDIYDTIFNY